MKHLHDRGITTEVSARSAPVAVMPSGEKVTKSSDGTWIHKAKNSKIIAKMDGQGKMTFDDVKYDKDEVQVHLELQELVFGIGTLWGKYCN